MMVVKLSHNLVLTGDRNVAVGVLGFMQHRTSRSRGTLTTRKMELWWQSSAMRKGFNREYFGWFSLRVIDIKFQWSTTSIGISQVGRYLRSSRGTGPFEIWTPLGLPLRCEELTQWRSKPPIPGFYSRSLGFTEISRCYTICVMLLSNKRNCIREGCNIIFLSRSEFKFVQSALYLTVILCK